MRNQVTVIITRIGSEFVVAVNTSPAAYSTSFGSLPEAVEAAKKVMTKLKLKPKQAFKKPGDLHRWVGVSSVKDVQSIFTSMNMLN